MMERLVITGINGFIGRHIAEEASKSGYQVAGLDIKAGNVENAEVTVGDIRNATDVDSVMKNVDLVIHLAAITSNVEFEKEPRACYETNVNGFLNVIDSAYRNKCKKFLYASSAAIYLDEFSENTLIDYKKQKNHYAKTKIINEMVAQSYHDIYSMDTVGLRFFNVYGIGENEKGNYASVITLFANANAAGKPIELYGDGSQSRDMINANDVAKITLMLLKSSKYQIYNVGTGNATSYETVADMINKEKKTHVKNPLSSYQLLTKADLSRLRETIGDYKFTDLAEGINEVLKHKAKA